MTSSAPSHLFQNCLLFDGVHFLEGFALRTDSQGKIAEMGPDLNPNSSDLVVDLNGRWLLPGLVDCHVHFREPGLVRKEGYLTGSAGALHGGVTTVLEIQNNPPLMESAALLRKKMEDLRGVSRVDYAPYGSLTRASIGALEGMKGLVPAVKCFLGASTGSGGVKNLPEMRELFSAAQRAGHQVVAHCEDDEVMRQANKAASPETASRHDLMRPVEAETKSIQDAISVAEETGVRLHVFHISTKIGAELVRQAAQRGLPITGTTGPQYLLVEANEAARAPQNRFKVNPSIKYAEDRIALISAIEEGLLQGVGTDHAPHPLEDKARPYQKAPSGFPSIDLLLPLMISAHDRFGLSLERALAAVTLDPAEEFGLKQKGRLAVGADADLVVCDPETSKVVKESELPSKSKWSPYNGRELRAFPEQVYLRGKLVFENGKPIGKPCGRPLFL
ncbi:MAG: dihydroorotase family protein [Planctomycetota bacterium]|jgi:dihydroorotase|nr:dihydroorotase family protein [Planctomycetota bacterium]MDP6942252.1 dihydroorotase family protein [Planctomycetota bacterium]